MSISGIGGGAQHVRSFQPPSFSSLDSDSSGGISLEELEAGAPGGATDSKSTERAKKLFAAMDTDGNGSVSSNEKDAFDSKIESQRQAMQFMAQLLGNTQKQQQPSNDDVFSATDTDGNGSISLDEFSSTAGSSGLATDDLRSLFGIIDSNSDGSISSTESSDFLDTLKAATSGPQDGPPPGPPPGGMGGPGGPPPDAVASSDSDSDSDSSGTATSSLLSLATASYTRTSKQTDLLTAITSLLQKAA